MKILFFTETLFCGGKERRLLELIQYLKKNTDHSITLIITERLIHYEYVFELGIPVEVIERKYSKYDPRLFFKFYKSCLNFKPDIIHAWGRMTTFYAIPSKWILKVPLISSMISDARKDFKNFSLSFLFFKADILFADIILSNSKAGLAAYKIDTQKARVIWNGVNPDRFQQKFDTEKTKKDLGISDGFIVIMVAAFTSYKDYDLFLDVAKGMGKLRNDVSFIGVGDGPNLDLIRQRVDRESLTNVFLTGRKNEVESLIAASDIGLLCTYSEGISNSIIEYMALGKPVISTDLVGGSREIIIEGVTGYCTERNSEKLNALLNHLLNNPELRASMGAKGKERIYSYFSIDGMGNDFNTLYHEVIAKNQIKNRKITN